MCVFLWQILDLWGREDLSTIPQNFHRQSQIKPSATKTCCCAHANAFSVNEPWIAVAIFFTISKLLSNLFLPS